MWLAYLDYNLRLCDISANKLKLEYQRQLHNDAMKEFSFHRIYFATSSTTIAKISLKMF